MIVQHLHKVHGLLTVLDESTAEMLALRTGRAVQLHHGHQARHIDGLDVFTIGAWQHRSLCAQSAGTPHDVHTRGDQADARRLRRVVDSTAHSSAAAALQPQ